MNFLGDDMNPLQFQPSLADIREAGMTEEEWKATDETAAAPYYGYTVGQAQAHLRASVETAYAATTTTTTTANTEASTTVRGAKCEEILEAFMKDMNIDMDASIASLIKGRVLDLHLDNKWLSSSDPLSRCNAIVFALSPYTGSDGVVTIQRKGAQANPQEYRERILAFFLTKCPDQYNMHPTKDDDNAYQKQWASLLLWDLLCLFSVSQSPEAFDSLSHCSMLVTPGSDNPRPMTERIAAIVKPLTDFCVAQPAGTPVVLGCQELPTDDNSDVWLESVLSPMGLKCRRQVSDVSITTGFIHSAYLDAGFVDMSTVLNAQLTEFLKSLDVSDRIIGTTIRRAQVACYDINQTSSGDPYYVAVVNFHCKSFKKLTGVQGKFMAKAMELAALLVPVEGGEPVKEAVLVGDMNLEAPWPKGTNPEEQRKAVLEAEPFMIPEGNRESMAPFGEELDKAGIETFPPLNYFTTLKLRTRFQAQPEKEGDINCSRKDFVFASTNVEKPNVMIDQLLVGGRDDATAEAEGNLALLMPSRLWPGDHFAILAMMTFGVNVSSGVA
eukprot:CAMPEP_0119495656 /NCGR_PEP_ID=MMETSP1344-20130328/19206_1 /TAXON_ID=236787 /ORGANISM="Florenciella parvula, Strain CCMP2471" /LENGTH=554 /DNA_ID=CAMNT_0007531255 /DNA_START=357 /DNA_END=2018 /DNA_ORIENTATION=-